MLTRKQADLLQFIEQHLATHGIPPSFEEMKAAVQIQSKSGIHRLITALEERGFVRRIPHRARALEVLRSVKSTQLPTKESNTAAMVARVPVMDTAPDTQIDEFVTIPGDFINHVQTEIYGMKIRDDSMAAAGILVGDTALISRNDSPSEGSIVAVTIDKSQTVLRYFYCQNDRITLKAANSDSPAEDLNKDRMAINGCLTGLLRRY